MQPRSNKGKSKLSQVAPGQTGDDAAHTLSPPATSRLPGDSRPDVAEVSSNVSSQSSQISKRFRDSFCNDAGSSSSNVNTQLSQASMIVEPSRSLNDGTSLTENIRFNDYRPMTNHGEACQDEERVTDIDRLDTLDQAGTLQPYRMQSAPGMPSNNPFSFSQQEPPMHHWATSGKHHSAGLSDETPARAHFQSPPSSSFSSATGFLKHLRGLRKKVTHIIGSPVSPSQSQSSVGSSPSLSFPHLGTSGNMGAGADMSKAVPSLQMQGGLGASGSVANTTADALFHRKHHKSSASFNTVHKRHLTDYVAPPRYIGAYKENCFVCEAVKFFLLVIATSLENRGPYGKIAVGLSGGSTPKKIFSTLAAMCKSAAAKDAESPTPEAVISESYEPNCTKLSAENTAEKIVSLFAGYSGSGSSDSHKHLEKIDWNRVVWFLVDERYVPPDDPCANQKMIQETLFANGVLQTYEENVVFPNTTLPLEECVSDYDQRLQRLFRDLGPPSLVTLGLGDDGHLASWFPPLSGSEFSKTHCVWHTTQNRFPVPDRITISMSVICAASEKLFFLSGESKIKKWAELMALDFEQNLLREPALQVVASGDTTVISYPPYEEDRLDSSESSRPHEHVAIVIFGASGDLARRKTLPALFSLFCEGYLPENFHIIGYARTKMSLDEYWQNLEPSILALDNFFKGGSRYQEALLHDKSLGLLDTFRSRLIYVSGRYDAIEDFQNLSAKLEALALQGADISGTNNPTPIENRVFYLALPPTVFLPTIRLTRHTCWSRRGWNRAVVEKPFGRDSKSAQALSDAMLRILKEEETYRIDHYLGKEMVLNLMALRFANVIFSPLMSRHYISAVRITFKETIGTAGRGGYFDNFGIIRDILQNHLLQLLTIIAMERPASLMDDDVRDEKVKVLKQIPPVELENLIVGQYTASPDGKIPGYLDDPQVPKNSTCPTFSIAILYIQNDRWARVPFILKAGKALEEQLAEIRIQYHSVPGNLFGDSIPQNDLEQTELDLSVPGRFDVLRMPDAYERLILDVLQGDKQKPRKHQLQAFHGTRDTKNAIVRAVTGWSVSGKTAGNQSLSNEKTKATTHELREAWRIFTPVLQRLEEDAIKPIPYPAGSRGPEEGYQLIKKSGYIKYEGYRWVPAPRCQ